MRVFLTLILILLLIQVPLDLAAHVHLGSDRDALAAEPPATVRVVALDAQDAPTSARMTNRPAAPGAHDERGAGRRAAAHPDDSGAGPDVIIIDELVHLFGPVRFDHAVHASMSRLQAGCASCHHQQDPNEKGVRACRACHRRETLDVGTTFDLPSLKAAYHRQCLACHRDWSGANDCGSCHIEVARGTDPLPPLPHDPTDIIGVHHPSLDGRTTFVFETSFADAPIVTFHHADHIERFGLGCADCHRESSCSSCHGAKAAGTFAPIDRHERCFSCHGESRCAMCHDDAPRERFEHGLRTGWVLGRHHASRPCADCHGPTRTFSVPASTRCRSCHERSKPEDFDHAVTGIPLAGSHAHFACSRCHDERRADAPATCRNCHPDRSYPEQWPGRETPPDSRRDR